jgi:ribosomal protein L40E
MPDARPDPIVWTDTTYRRNTQLLCPSCHAENMEQAKFCTTCATPLKRPDVASAAEDAARAETSGCIQCRAQLPPGARFCASCGASQSPVTRSPFTADPDKHAQPEPDKAQAGASPSPATVSTPVADQAAQAKSMAWPVRNPGMARKWLPVVAAFLVGCVIGGIVVYKKQPDVASIDSSQPATVSSVTPAAAPARRSSEAAPKAAAKAEAENKSSRNSTKPASSEAPKAAPVANDVQACQRETNVFKKEICMIRACNNRWGTGDCPSYEDNRERSY